MTTILCTREDLDDADVIVPVNVGLMDEDECQNVVLSVRNFFASFLDLRPYRDVGVISVRAENVLRRNHAKTIADVRRLYVQATSSQGVFGAGRMVRDEWASLLR
jgi:hypothetical protein